MRFSVRTNAVSLGSVDLPPGLLVAAPLEPSAAYTIVADVVRVASDAFLHLGLFDAVAPMVPPIPAQRRRWRRALSQAARLQLALIGADGARAPADFVNLVEAPGDRRIIVLASFVSAFSWVGAVPMASIAAPGRGAVAE